MADKSFGVKQLNLIGIGTPTIESPSNINLDAVNVAISTDATVGRNLNVAGIVTATGGFVSIANTTPIKITLSGTTLTFTATGIGSTSLTLS